MKNKYINYYNGFQSIIKIKKRAFFSRVLFSKESDRELADEEN